MELTSSMRHWMDIISKLIIIVFTIYVGTQTLYLGSVVGLCAFNYTTVICMNKRTSISKLFKFSALNESGLSSTD